MRHLIKIGIAAAAAIFAASTSASAAVVTTFCEDSGSPWAGGTHPGRCAPGDVSTGVFDITTFDAGSFGAVGEKLVFKGYGDNGDSDIWQFTATRAFNFSLDQFSWAGVGTNTGFLDAFLTDPNGVVTHLTSAVMGITTGLFLPGTYQVMVLGSLSNATDIYNYDLSVQAVPVPGAALLFLSALAGGAFAGRRRRTNA